MPLVAKEQVWADDDNNLVPDGHEKAARMVARAGQRIALNRVRQHENYREFFNPANAGDQFPASDAEEKAEQEASNPKKNAARVPKAQFDTH